MVTREDKQSCRIKRSAGFDRLQIPAFVGIVQSEVVCLVNTDGKNSTGIGL